MRPSRGSYKSARGECSQSASRELRDGALSTDRAAVAWQRSSSSTAKERLAARVAEMVESDALEALAAREFEGREVVIDGGRAVRRWPAGSLVIYDRRRGEVLEVLRVFDARREPIER